MAFAAEALVVTLLAVIARRRFTQNMTGAEFRHRLRVLEKPTRRR